MRPTVLAEAIVQTIIVRALCTWPHTRLGPRGLARSAGQGGDAFEASPRAGDKPPSAAHLSKANTLPRAAE